MRIAEPSVRAELMEQVPHIAMYCQEFKSKLSHVVPESLLPMVVKCLEVRILCPAVSPDEELRG